MRELRIYLRQLLFGCLLICCTSIEVYGQINHVYKPQSGAFLARDFGKSVCTFYVSGEITDANYSQLSVAIYQSDAYIYQVKSTLNFIGGKADFNLKITLPAGKYYYKLEYKLTGVDLYTETVTDIMVGDVYLIQGQSNSVAGDYGRNANTKFNPSYYDPFIRSFGTSSQNGSVVQSDLNWCDVNASGFYSRGCVGQWGVVMAKSLLDSFGYPICLINGGVGGTRIAQHIPSPGNHENLATIYGRLLYRVRQAGYENHIKGILYFQGESDGGLAVHHDTLFTQLYNHWNTDFPGFKKLYVIQVRSGCGNPSIQLRDVQRRFEYSLPKCQTVSANGLNNHDGCHYGFVNGYELLGLQMANLLARDFYKGRSENINPPTIRDCYYSNGQQTEVTLNMQNPSDSVFADANFHTLFKVEGDNSVSITSGIIRDNQVVLYLSKSSCLITGLSYDGLPGYRPWVKSSTKMGLVSFYNVPILNHQTKQRYFSCKNDSVLVGEPAVPGCTYTWTIPSKSMTFTSAQLKLNINREAHLSLIIGYANACRSNDTIDVIALTDTVDVPNLGIDRDICIGDTVILKPNIVGYLNMAWSIEGNKIYKWSHYATRTESIFITAHSLMGCTYTDSVIVTKHEPVVALPQDFITCPETNIKVEASSGFKAYSWNGNSGTNNYSAGLGLLILQVLDSFNCMASDSTFIHSHITPKRLQIDLSVCEGDSSFVTKPDHLKEWSSEGMTLPDTIIIQSLTQQSILLTDSNSCSVMDTILSTPLLLPKFDLGNDTILCEGNSLNLFLPIGDYKYNINGVSQTSSSYPVAEAGLYQVVVSDSSGCMFQDQITVHQSPLPSLSMFHDTILCTDSSWTILLDPNLSFLINNNVVRSKYIIDSGGTFSIKATDDYGCSNHLQIEVTLVNCNLAVNDFTITRTIQIFPNPFQDLLYFNNPTKTSMEANLLDVLGRKQMSFIIEPGVSWIDVKKLSYGQYIIQTGHTHWKIFKSSE